MPFRMVTERKRSSDASQGLGDVGDGEWCLGARQAGKQDGWIGREPLPVMQPEHRLIERR